ncbi:MAG: methyltransferase domain-containing protein [Planctomycetota bacterium]|nr:methyltransferase domain-containing protein [Planctomycetota bacterium]
MTESTDSPFWEGLYANRDAVDTFGPPNPEILELVPTLPSGARVLDLGCGEGRLMLPLAAAGFEVVGVDVSAAGVEKLQRVASDRGLSVDASVADLNEFSITGDFDLMLSDGVFHNIHREHAERLISEMKEHTRPGGYNLVKLFTTKVPPPPELARFHIGLWEEEELFDRYEGWEFLIRKSFILEDEHPDGSRHRHPINKILARKPG